MATYQSTSQPRDLGSFQQLGVSLRQKFAQLSVASEEVEIIKRAVDYYIYYFALATVCRMVHSRDGQCN